MYLRDSYPDEPFSPERQTEWVRCVLELMAAYSEAVPGSIPISRLTPPI